ncbi:CDP-alcohol phosphatidyltransferase family protein [Phreatobacter sp.]|uniref:CDP-alcohol phosphatidyltransferase family protein n=1 Tax=Phreatobacter sp. TaxID=1966341 RepID=UPI0022C337A7|nr:CDP-alcohol phosphatidyltransferase family protein [Phreatobacter sp.]MCZ8313851.1 CDP-alcohol phosphatidyltransferase family protein [Phreatobacter sp.]
MSESWVSRVLASLEKGASLQDVARSAAFAGALGRVAAILARTGVTPNTLTLLSLTPALASAVFAAYGALAWSAVFLLLSGLFDMLDGPLARSTGTVSRYGALLDSTVDRVTDALPLLGLTVFFSTSGWMAVVPAFTLLAAYTVSYVRARCEGLKVQLPPLWMRRGDRMVLIALALLLGPFSPGFTLFGVGLVGVLSILAAADALRVARNVIDARQPEVRGLPDAPTGRDGLA